MLRALSTHVFLRQRLHPGLLDTLARGGAQAIEVFAAKPHFDYTSRQHIKEIADWFQSSDVKPHSLHAPMYADSEMGRGGMPAINVLHNEKSRRIDGMDEVKRALEAAEILPYQFLVLHIGDRDSEWDERALENALTAIEHLKAFGGPLGALLPRAKRAGGRPPHSAWGPRRPSSWIRQSPAHSCLAGCSYGPEDHDE